jgi:hypothetical protein
MNPDAAVRGEDLRRGRGRELAVPASRGCFPGPPVNWLTACCRLADAASAGTTCTPRGRLPPRKAASRCAPLTEPGPMKPAWRLCGDSMEQVLPSQPVPVPGACTPPVGGEGRVPQIHPGDDDAVSSCTYRVNARDA